ncbi:response regulator, partial [Myxococcota bacterium]|nr:response regulator [Myxococcota bacterium]
MSKTLMVVDDSATIRRAVELVFRATGFDVVAAKSGPEALSLLDRVKPSIVLVDAMMEGMDGFELVAFLKDHDATSDAPILLMVSATDPDVARVEAAEVDGYVLKPFAAHELLDPVRMLTGELIRREAPLSFAQQLADRRTEQAQSEARRKEEQRLAMGALGGAPTDPEAELAFTFELGPEPPRTSLRRTPAPARALEGPRTTDEGRTRGADRRPPTAEVPRATADLGPRSATRAPSVLGAKTGDVARATADLG